MAGEMDKLKGKVKELAGAATDDPSKESEGQLDQAKGNIKEAAENLKDRAKEALKGSAEKAKLRREILDGPIAHLAEVGKRAGRRITDLGLAFRYRPGSQSYVGFRTAARTMQATAESKKEVLMKFGLSEAVLVQFGELVLRERLRRKQIECARR